MNAKKLSEVSSEKEIVELMVTSAIVEEIPEANYLGDKLTETSLNSGNWKNVTIGETTYNGNGWYLLKKDVEIQNYGKTKLNWLINYNTGKVIELEDGKYIIKSADGSGAITDESLSLNINPSNLQNSEEWGDGIQFCSGTEGDDSGVKETEIKFDGVDDYLRINNVDVSKSGGITFEFYGKDYNKTIHLLNRTFFNSENFDLKARVSGFRNYLSGAALTANLGLGEAHSDHQGTTSADCHWLYFTNCRLSGEDYISFTLNLNDQSKQYCQVLVYKNGLLVDSSSCGEHYLKTGDIFNNDIPFTVGCQVTVTNGVGNVKYSKLDLYACRLYNRVLSDDEIKYNFDKTIEYRKSVLEN